MATQAIRQILRKWGFDPEPLKAVVEEWNKDKYGEVAVNPPSIAAAARADVVIALPAGTAPLGTEGVLVQPPPTLEAGLFATRFWISAVDQLTITIANHSAGAVDGAALNWTYYIMGGSTLSAGR